MDNITRIVTSLEDSGLITDGGEHEIIKQKDGYFGAMMAPMTASLTAPMASSLKQPVASSVINSIFRKGLKGGLALPLMMKVFGKGVKGA